MAVLYPSAIGKGPDHVLFSKGTKEYKQNAGLDIDKDGHVTVHDAAHKVRALLSEAGAGIGEVLRNGSKGAEVEKLQDQLVQFGYLTAEEKSTGAGTFGPRTERALIAFQTDNHLAANGTVAEEPLGGLSGLVRRVSDLPPRDGQTLGHEQGLGVGFLDLHGRAGSGGEATRAVDGNAPARVEAGPPIATPYSVSAVT
jgi:peptidoglycan hydrolase-like protein with peptidoglycan-binding domain